MDKHADGREKTPATLPAEGPQQARIQYFVEGGAFIGTSTYPFHIQKLKSGCTYWHELGLMGGGGHAPPRSPGSGPAQAVCQHHSEHYHRERGTHLAVR